jgi:hypothetical protein
VTSAELYLRQMILAEIGEVGQDKLASAVARLVGVGLCHEIAVSYAERAGVGAVVAGEIDEPGLAPAFMRYPAARAVVAGSRAALLAIRQAVER